MWPNAWFRRILSHSLKKSLMKNFIFLCSERIKSPIFTLLSVFSRRIDSMYPNIQQLFSIFLLGDDALMYTFEMLEL